MTTHDIWIRIETNDDGRLTGRCGLEGEEEFASVSGARDYWATMYALTPYVAALCAEDPFGMIPPRR